MRPRRKIAGAAQKSQSLIWVVLGGFFFLYICVFYIFVGRRESGGGKKQVVGFLFVSIGHDVAEIRTSHDNFLKHVFLSNDSSFDYRLIYFTDQSGSLSGLQNDEKTIFIHVPKKDWMGDLAMNNYELFLHHRFLIEGFDHIYSVDMDLDFQKEVTPKEILNELVTLKHFQYESGSGGPFEGKEISQAYVSKSMQKRCNYYNGKYYGGTMETFFKAVDIMTVWFNFDQRNNIVPAHGYESYLNKYICVNHRSSRGTTFLDSAILKSRLDKTL